jgi:hypothetical protein
MSDKSEGPGWWVASDGKWYPPELHPSVTDESGATASSTKVDEGPPPRRWQGQSDGSTHVGPQFPDLFKKALEGSHLADNVSVKYAGDDERNVTAPVAGRSMAGARAGGGARGVTSASSTIGPPAKRKWRKGR